MSDINWDLAPHKAVELVQYGFRIAYRDAAGNVYLSTGWEYLEAWDLARVIATRPQPERKTVEDLVEWNKSEGFGDKWKYEDCDVIVIYEDSFAYSNSKTTTKPIVCTREEFEVCVAARADGEPHFKATRENLEKIAEDAEGERWTHTYGKNNCYIKVSEPDFQGYIVIYSEVEGYMLVGPRELKPIKPTITKAEAWDIIEQVNGLPDYIKEQYTITD